MELEKEATVYSSETVDKDLREFFRAERKRLRLNQEDVAAAGGIEQSTISKIERDAPYDPGLNSFLRAIRGLGVAPSEFFAKFEGNLSIEKSALQLPKTSSQNRLAGQISEKAAHHGGRAVPSSSISEEDLRAFFRILQQAFGGSILEAIDAQTHRRAPGARPRKTKTGKGA